MQNFTLRENIGENDPKTIQGISLFMARISVNQGINWIKIQAALKLAQLDHAIINIPENEFFLKFLILK